MSTKSYFFIILFLLSVIDTDGFVNITNVASTENTNNVASATENIVNVATEKAKTAPKASPKLNAKQTLMLNQIVGSYALGGIENELCKNHTTQYKEALRNFEPWALQMFDASSKLQPGLLVGNTGEFGSFEQCLQIYTNSTYGPIQGQMCTLKIVPGPNLTKSILKIRKLPISSFDQIVETIKFNTLWSVCLPDSCPTSDVIRHFNRTLLGITQGLDVEISIRNDGCVSYKTVKPISDVQWLVIIGIGSLLIFVTICTAYDIFMTKYNQSSANEGLLIFSAYSNARNIFSNQSDSSDLDCLNGIRSLSICWVILGHRYLHTMFVPIVDGLAVLDWMQTLSSTIVIGGTVSVDSFFMVSGLLLSYIFFSTMEKGVSFNLPLFYLHRYMRVTPVLGLIVLLYAQILELLGSGPIWHSTIEGLKDPCVNYWWSCLLHVQNYFNPSDLCIVQTWYLTCDMQYYFFSPLVLYPMWHWPHFGFFIFFVFFALAIGLNFQLAWLNQYNGSMPVTNELLQTKYFANHYSTPYTRASPYLVGIMIGYILFKTKNKKIIMNSGFSFFAWIVSLGTISCVVFGSLPFQQLEHPYSRLESSLYLAVSRPSWAIALGWIIFNCVNGTGGIINTILSSYIFKVLAKISYSMFLTHMLIMFTLGGAEKTTFYFSNLTMLYMFFGDFAFTIIASFILCICVEVPIIRMDAVLRKRVSNKKVDVK